jgi:hypothetical protein
LLLLLVTFIQLSEDCRKSPAMFPKASGFVETASFNAPQLQDKTGAITHTRGDMMRRFIGVVILVCMISMLGMAQETPRPEIYGGYQFTSTDGGWHASGWNTAANMYITRWLGATADFSGVYHTGTNLYTYTFGPVVSTHKSSFSPYAHALFGGAHTATGSFSDSGMTMMFGGGADFGKRKLVFRAVQFDWMILRFSGVSDKNNMRVNTGFLYRF